MNTMEIQKKLMIGGIKSEISFAIMQIMKPGKSIDRNTRLFHEGGWIV